MKNNFFIFILITFLYCSTPSSLEKSTQLQKLDAAANLLMQISDETKEINNTCKLSPSDARSFILMVHAMIDEEEKNHPGILRESCSGNKIDCANITAKWFCESQLLKKLKSEVEPPAQAL